MPKPTSKEPSRNASEVREDQDESKEAKSFEEAGQTPEEKAASVAEANKELRESRISEPEEAKKPYYATMHPNMQTKAVPNVFAKTTTEGMKHKSLSPYPPQKAPYRPAPGAKASTVYVDKAPAALDFVYSYDFDENGLLYFLGTYGKTKPWVNPFTIGQVTVFSSSLGHGALEDIVGRAATNCRTLNESFSFFAIDLGGGRQFRPACYTLRNRSISS